jgi:Ca-activated chloride channel family protein
MRRALRRRLAIGLAMAGLAGLAGCSSEPTGTGTFTIASGSENRTIEPIVQEFCKTQRVTCKFEYMGSLDIGLAVAENRGSFDAVWPANGIWIDMFDRAKRVRDLTPIARSPVILGVRRAKAEELGWIGRDVSSSDIVAAVRAKRLTFLASSATQSNSGAGAYIAMLSAALGHPDAITPADLERPDLRDTVRTLLSGISRTAGSSGWLADLYLKGIEQGTHYDAMWNYEAVLAETNEELRRRGVEQLYAIYPSDGAAFANSPLGFIDRGHGEAQSSFFAALQKHMLSAEVQKQLVALHRRPAIGEATGVKPDPSWNYDPTRLVTLVRMPEPAVVRAALDLYQEGLRPPSLTVYCLDFSGSMQGKGEESLKAAMRFILSHDASAPLLVQHGPHDQIVVIPFDGEVRRVVRGSGSAADQARLLDAVMNEHPSDGTDIYACAERGLAEIAATPNAHDYLAAIVVMTDGKSEDNARRFLSKWKLAKGDIPVFGITFGEADATQLDRLAEATRARVFDGTKSLSEAFRAVRGYN